MATSDLNVLKLEMRPFIKRGFATGPGNVAGTTLVDATLVEAATFWNDCWVLLRTGTYAGQLRRVTASVPGTLTLDHTVGGLIAAGVQYVMLPTIRVTIVAGGGLKADLQQVFGQFFSPILKGRVFNTAVALDTDFFDDDLEPTNTPTTFRIYVALDTAGILSVQRTSVPAATVAEQLNSGAALVANAAYLFDVLVHSADTINLQTSVGAQILYCMVTEVPGAMA